jgi:ribosomal protein S18 acetylase RimI-like enzyme
MTNDDISYRAVEACECDAVVVLHRAVFRWQEVRRTINGCHGAARYLANLIAFSQWQDENLVWGAWVGNRLIGYAHFRTLPDSFHLNYIAVLREYQMRGVGTALWGKFIETAMNRDYRKISLDVIGENRRAVRWYEREGMETSERMWLYEKALFGKPADSGAVRLQGWEQADAWQSVYGFSQFRLIYKGKSWDINRLGDDLICTTEPLPPEIEGVLLRVAPHRRLLFRSTQLLSGNKERVHLWTTLRMCGKTCDMV